MSQIAVLIDARLHNELVLRTRKTADVTAYIEHALETFLERTRLDGDLWSVDYIAGLSEIEADVNFRKYGDPNKGYHWQMIFLPNGARLKITYKGRDYFAEVQQEKIVSDGKEISPSEWASSVANFTSRNAWRDIWVQLPTEDRWMLADAMRQAAKERGNG